MLDNCNPTRHVVGQSIFNIAKSGLVLTGCGSPKTFKQNRRASARCSKLPTRLATGTLNKPAPHNSNMHASIS